MNHEQASDIIRQLADGLDPISGRALALDDPCQHPQIVRALFVDKVHRTRHYVDLFDNVVTDVREDVDYGVAYAEELDLVSHGCGTQCSKRRIAYHRHGMLARPGVWRIRAEAGILSLPGRRSQQ